MNYKLYRYDYSGGYSLGGADYGPGTEWYITDKDDDLKFVKRDGVDDGFWEHTGLPRQIKPCDNNVCKCYFVSCMTGKDVVAKLKFLDLKSDIMLEILNKTKIINPIFCLELSED